ncbi:MAG: aspartate/glutamate racemase family protein [Tabrizicola sp.]|jgi:Asp/Glu/hydantoin racemase|nr:aspartate/glutamate racemase family protein [Tabrizicola sp.]
MRLLLVNPNMTQAMTDRMAALARAAAPGAEVMALTAPRGFPYISSLAEAQIAGAIALEMIAEAGPVDAAIIAAFGDPGLPAARELFGFPVVGMAEASILSALQLGQRFAIVTFTPAMRGWYLASVEALGAGPRCLGVRTPPDHIAQVGDVAETRRAVLRDLATEAARDGAEVVILGGAPLAGLAHDMAGEVRATLLDPITAATRQAVALAGLGSGRAARPVPKLSTGLSPALARLIAQKDAP